MKKRLSVTLSAVCVSACALMAPVSVHGMRNNGSTPNQNRSFLFQEMLQRCGSEIGKAFHEAALNADFERMTAIVSSTRSQGKNIADEVMSFYQHKPFLPTFLHECENPELVRFAVENGMRELINYKVLGTATPLITARNAAVMQAFIDNGAVINRADISITNLFFHVHNAEVAQLLIDNGANVNRADPFMGSPLFSVHNAEVAQVLIDRGADVNHTSWFGRTPLFCAYNAEVAQLLIDRGADVNHIDKAGETALMTTSNPQVAQVLIDNGANIDDLNSNRYMPRASREQLLRDNAK